jgi:hypothetical protein
MTDRTWFYAAGGQQNGPFPELQFRDLITQGVVQADTLVWTAGMAGWQKAGEIPGLLAGAALPPTVRQAAPATGGYGDRAVSIDLPVWPFFGRSLLFVAGLLLVIPAPWVSTDFYRWVVSRIQVPGRPNLRFNGQVGDIWYVFVLLGLLCHTGWTDSTLVEIISVVVQPFLSWMIVRWILGNLSSNGQPLPIAFNGSAAGYIGWDVLLNVSIVTIIGWAWVFTAWMRWIGRNIGGTHREIVFNASGLDLLWRSIVFAIGFALLIPIPWIWRWYTEWFVSQFSVVERGTLANS